MRVITDLILPEGVQGGTDERYRDAFFGRDALRIALDVGPWLPMLARHVLISCARLQGRADQSLSEEEPGRIHHEYRSMFVGGRRIHSSQRELLGHLARLWGSDDGTVIYFGATDTTPQFLRLLEATVRLQGESILDEQILHRSGATVTLSESAEAAARWIVSQIERSDLGLLEFLRRNPAGQRFQVMRDGVTSYLHESGELANSDLPIASLEVQGLAFDALLGAARLLRDPRPDDAEHWEAVAMTLRASALAHFWQQGDEYFCMAIDRDAAGVPRPVRTASSNASELLETRLFDDLSPGERCKYVGAIVRAIYSPEFLTDAGIRAMARRYYHLLPYFDYQGALATWPTVTNVFAQGLRRHGFQRLAVDQEHRYLNAVNLAGDLVEFLYVAPDGRVDYDPYCQREIGAAREALPAVDVPARGQGWTASAALRALLERTKGVPPGYESGPGAISGLAELEADALDEPITLLRTREAVDRALTITHPFRIDTNAGRALRRAHWGERGVRLYAHDDAIDGFWCTPALQNLAAGERTAARRRSQQHREPTAALDQGADRGAPQANDEITLQ
jgi:glycogen debranching enzyme